MRSDSADNGATAIKRTLNSRGCTERAASPGFVIRLCRTLVRFITYFLPSLFAFPLALLLAVCFDWGRLFRVDKSTRTAVAIFAESTLYRAAVRARFESFSSGCLGL